MHPTLHHLRGLIFGTGRLKDPEDADHLAVAREAAAAGLWFHTAEEYGKGAVFATLKNAFGDRPAARPRLIAKVGGKSADLLRRTVDSTLRGLGIERLDIAQVCGGPEAETARPGGELYDTMKLLREQGKVDAYLLDIFHNGSTKAIPGVREQLYDGVIFYWNVVNREVDNDLYDLIQSTGTPIVSRRGLGGGPEAFVGPPSPEQARALLDDLYAQSGCSDRMTFRMRFALNLPGCLGTIAATQSPKHLQRLLCDAELAEALPVEIHNAIHAAQRNWFADKGQA